MVETKRAPTNQEGAQEHSKGFSRRIRYGKDQRRTFRIAGVRNRSEANTIGRELEAMARRLNDAGYAAESAVMLDNFAKAEQDSERTRLRRLADSLCAASFK